MKKILGYLVLAASAFGLGSLIQEVKIRKLKKKLSAIGTKKEELLEMEARMKQILATHEKVKQIKDENEKYIQLADEIVEISQEENDYEYRINTLLTKFMDENNIPKPWGDRDFNEFMRDPNAVLKFD